MKKSIKTTTTIITILFASVFWCNAQNCGTTIFIDEFNTDGSLPVEWTEFNTNGRVTVDGGRLKFDYTADQPGAYRTFTPVSENVSLSFTEESTRNWVKCRFDILSSDNKYLASIIFGNDGAGTVQYALSLDASNTPTSFTGALVDGAYQKNYEYSFAITFDFSNHTFDFYNDGIIKADDIPFLQSSTDIAKVSITQISMYSSEGRFFFDNIALSYPGPDRSGLSTAISNANGLIRTAIISPLYGYTEESYEALKFSIEQSNIVLDNCDATQAEIDIASLTLETAITDFESAYIDENVISLYSGYDFTGTEREYKCGHYNGNLNDFEDIPVSFKLAKGYMATFAQDINGLGFSKVYIAQDNALEINLPAELQKSISFMRVSPWFEVGKKGGLGNATHQEKLETEWYYTWGLGQPYQTSGYSTSEIEFAPMSWSGGDNFCGLDKVTSIGQNMAFNHHLAFNEPDLEEQSNMTVERALEVYPSLLASGLRIGSPAVSHGGMTWIKEFMDGCIERGYRVDFIAIHDYVRRSPAAYISRFEELYDLYNVPIWVTEYNYGNPGMGSPDLEADVTLAKIKAMTEKFEETDFIERYAWYYFFSGTNNLGAYTNGELNERGIYYRNLVSPAPSYIQQVYAQGPEIPTNIDDQLNSAGQVEVYPNPVTKGKINLSIPNDISEECNILLYDLGGNEILAKQNTTQLEVSHLKNGVYILHIKSTKVNIVHKVLIQN